MSYEENLKVYDALVAKCPRFARKGKTMPYTSENGYMFSFLNKAAEIGIRFSKETQNEYLTRFNTTHFKSNGAIMKGYILITDDMLGNLDSVAKLLNESYDYVMTLKAK